MPSRKRCLVDFVSRWENSWWSRRDQNARNVEQSFSQKDKNVSQSLQNVWTNERKRIEYRCFKRFERIFKIIDSGDKSDENGRSRINFKEN